MRRELIFLKSCFDGYLTEHCAECEDWHNGEDGCVGCATRQPIMECPHFAKMMEDESKKRMRELGL